MRGANSIKLLTGNSHPELAQAVAKRLGIPLTECVCRRFADQSVDVRIGSSVRDEDVFVIQTGNSPYLDPNDALMELLIILSACKTASARRITAVIPAFPYSRHDKKDKSRAPITAKLVANMITVAGADHVITMDLHASQIQGFFDIPVDNLSSETSIARWIRSSITGWRDAIIVSPDAGGAKRTTALADSLGVDFALINRNRRRELHKRQRAAALAAARAGNEEEEAQSTDVSRPDTPETTGLVSLTASMVLGEAGEGSASGKDQVDEAGGEGEGEADTKMEILVGEVKGKIAILVDDMVDTGRTLALAARTLEEAGASKVYAIISHGLLSGRSIELLRLANVEKLVVTNTIANAEKAEEAGGKLEVMDVSNVIAEAIRRTHNGESISMLFKDDGGF
ncbi:hypothetical protein CF319_g7163 [Tilletia indica]|uniref:ribose-phosphate diphosphokinase n=2 Tax=Tilletia TaxID=13289 RepID=A0A8X7N684_9BASI|nr:hypothetical protein CF327_g6617 [Tilletia walkeri]KAE8219076.1 hypothetical protein CF319_g7163 [Tilletia indica]KAE8230939.1 hypothetical protein CF326_g4051 [Tilletia indica]KAE8250009.1 hypothetical protein A4X13_0g4982 [Tilletia indica]KAE8266290.1 hypothetical protein A4X09_0g6058 [Tilletia walkeri]